MTDQLPAELADWPAWTPDEAQLGELELITSGAFAPLRGYKNLSSVICTKNSIGGYSVFGYN